MRNVANLRYTYICTNTLLVEGKDAYRNRGRDENMYENTYLTRCEMAEYSIT